MVFDKQTDSYVPVFYVLLTSKTKQIYSQALCWIEMTVGRKISPSTIIICDFKIALQNAISSTFPGVIINRCLFHWKQAIRCKIIDLKFKENVCERMMWENSLEVLTIINPSEIKWKGIPFVRSIVDDGLDQEDMKKMEKFWAYFDRFWLKSPGFIVTWNVFGHYKKETVYLQRTNNGLERYNRALNSKFQGKQSLLSFITVLEVEAREQVTKLDEIRNGTIVNKKRKRVESVNENDLELKIPSFYPTFNP